MPETRARAKKLDAVLFAGKRITIELDRHATLVYESRWLARWNRIRKLFGGRTNAMTLGHTILFADEKRLVPIALLGHEMFHVKQIEREGTAKFYLKYVWLLVRHGYARHPFELEAREASA